MITAVTASADPFGVLVPMLPLGLVGLWGARHGEFRPRPGVEPEVRPAPTRATRARASRAADDREEDDEWPSRRVSGSGSTRPASSACEVVLDFERYPDWARDVKQVTILERDDEGRARRSSSGPPGSARASTTRWQYDYSELPTAFSWKLVEGEGLRRLDGSYRFEPEDDSTRVHYELAVDIAIPLPGLIKRRAAGMIMGTALEGAEEGGRDQPPEPGTSRVVQ